MTKLFKIIILTTMLASGVAIAAEATPPQQDPALKWQKNIDKFVWMDKQNSFPKDAILFVGSSSIRMWETQTAFPKYKVINRGFGGAQISDVNYYIDNVVLPYKPSLIAFYCGDNDIAVGKSPEVILNDYKKFVQLARKNNPKQKILYVNIKACNNRWKLWPKMNMANEMIKQFCQTDKHLYYADTASTLFNKYGKPDDKYFIKDKLHLNANGYKRWNDKIRPFIKAAKKAKK